MNKSDIRILRGRTRQVLKRLVVSMVAVPTIMLLATTLLVGVFAALHGLSGMEHMLGFIGKAAEPAFLVPAQLSLAVYFIIAIDFAISLDNRAGAHPRHLFERLLATATGMANLWSSIISTTALPLFAAQLSERLAGHCQSQTASATPFLAGEAPQLE